MKTMKFIKEFVIYFVITFGVTLLVSWLYGLIFHGIGQVKWEDAFRLALIFSIIFPTINVINKKKD